jgi:hypothetical protein
MIAHSPSLSELILIGQTIIFWPVHIHSLLLKLSNHRVDHHEDRRSLHWSLYKSTLNRKLSWGKPVQVTGYRTQYHKNQMKPLLGVINQGEYLSWSPPSAMSCTFTLSNAPHANHFSTTNMCNLNSLVRPFRDAWHTGPSAFNSLNRCFNFFLIAYCTVSRCHCFLEIFVTFM